MDKGSESFNIKCTVTSLSSRQGIRSSKGNMAFEERVYRGDGMSDEDAAFTGQHLPNTLAYTGSEVENSVRSE